MLTLDLSGASYLPALDDQTHGDAMHLELAGDLMPAEPFAEVQPQDVGLDAWLEHVYSDPRSRLRIWPTDSYSPCPGQGGGARGEAQARASIEGSDSTW